ncbi:MAG: TMEM165/GDT1 family protein [Aquabacterium sp.]
MLETFFLSTGVVALAEIGDKTQLLALLLAVRFKRPLPIVAGIVVATLANHALAGALGAWISTLLDPMVLRWVVGVSFLAMAVWVLIPDRIEQDEARLGARLGVFGATVVTFFVAEMGDKTQIATVALATQASSIAMVVLGTTLGMVLANAPVVWLGRQLSRRVSMRLVHGAAAVLFALIGLAVLTGLADRFGV